MKESIRTHVLLPRAILESIDRLAGRRRRSQFLAEAAQEKLQRMDEARRRAERARLAGMLAGSLVDRTIPEWDTEDSAREWVRAGRRARDERLRAARGKP